MIFQTHSGSVQKYFYLYFHWFFYPYAFPHKEPDIFYGVVLDSSSIFAEFLVCLLKHFLIYFYYCSLYVFSNNIMQISSLNSVMFWCTCIVLLSHSFRNPWTTEYLFYTFSSICIHILYFPHLQPIISGISKCIFLLFSLFLYIFLHIF